MSDPDESPRSRLLREGPAALSAVELLSLLLLPRSRTEPTTVTAALTLERLGGVRKLARATPLHLTRACGIGPVTAARLTAAFELGRRVSREPLCLKAPLTSSQDVVAAYQAQLTDLSQEHFFVIALDSRNRPLGRVWSARGTMSTCPVQPADIMRVLIQAVAAGALLVHNHPSGDPHPSLEDIVLTQTLAKYLKPIGISLVDHVILSASAHFSFRDSGLLDSDFGADSGESQSR